MPVREIVSGTEVTPTGPPRLEAEVRGFVPAIARVAQTLDHPLEVPLHCLRLPLELDAMAVREPRSWLRFQLVPREMLRLERDRLVQIGVEVGGALARDAVQDVEGEVVESAIPKKGNGPAGGSRGRAPLEHGEQVWAKALDA